MDGDTGSKRLLTNRRLIGLVAAAALSLFIMLFVADNFVLIDVRLFDRGFQMRLAWAIIVPFLVGGALGYLAGRYRR
jgi:hypothetical protein